MIKINFGSTIEKRKTKCYNNNEVIKMLQIDKGKLIVGILMLLGIICILTRQIFAIIIGAILVVVSIMYFVRRNSWKNS